MAASPLDTSWIDEYESVERKYEMFYKENIVSVNIALVYVNSKLEIVKISQRDIDLENCNVVSKAEMADVIGANASVDGTEYSLLSLLTYNIDLTHNELKGFLEADAPDGGGFLRSLTSLQDIVLEPSIQLFQDINRIFVVYYEPASKQPPSREKRGTTRKIYMRPKSVAKGRRGTRRQ